MYSISVPLATVPTSVAVCVDGVFPPRTETADHMMLPLLSREIDHFSFRPFDQTNLKLRL
jgi:hypothetical protein